MLLTLTHSPRSYVPPKEEYSTDSPSRVGFRAGGVRVKVIRVERVCVFKQLLLRGGWR